MLHCTLKCLRQVLLSSILAIIVLCSVALYSKRLKRLLLRWFDIVFCRTHYGMLVLLSVFAIVQKCLLLLFVKLQVHTCNIRISDIVSVQI